MMGWNICMKEYHTVFDILVYSFIQVTVCKLFIKKKHTTHMYTNRPYRIQTCKHALECRDHLKSPHHSNCLSLNRQTHLKTCMDGSKILERKFKTSEVQLR